MNTRLQVEHPVTELVTGTDLVCWQMRIARGERLSLSPQQALTPSGHAIECRVYAEDPDAGFLPSPGPILGLRVPGGPGIRDDSWIDEGTDVPTYYDPLLSKLIAWGENRAQAVARMRRAVDEYEVRGVRTSLPFFRWLLQREEFASARFHTSFLDELLQRRGGEPFDRADPSLEEVAAIAAGVIESAGALPLEVADRLPGRRELPAPARQVSGWARRARLDGLRA
jgi:acetyl-CoA carboxylase biotin carboxylase subunit